MFMYNPAVVLVWMNKNGEWKEKNTRLSTALRNINKFRFEIWTLWIK